MSFSQRLPHTEGLAPIRLLAPIQETQGIAKLKAEDKHAALIESERVLSGLYGVVAGYDAALLTEDVRGAMLALPGALRCHSLAEQCARLEIAVAALRKCPAMMRVMRVRRALADVDRFLLLPEEAAK